MNIKSMIFILFIYVLSGFTGHSQIKEVYIEGNDQLKFSVETIKAKPGQTLKITLKTISNMDKSQMAHNWVLLKKGTDGLNFVSKGLQHADNDYIDPKLEDKIIAATEMLGGGETDTITFKVPEEKGTYEYVCTFRAHYQAGMKGKLIVE